MPLVSIGMSANRRDMCTPSRTHSSGRDPGGVFDRVRLRSAKRLESACVGAAGVEIDAEDEGQPG